MFAVCSVQCVVSSMKGAVCSVLCIMYSAHSAMCIKYWGTLYVDWYYTDESLLMPHYRNIQVLVVSGYIGSFINEA